MRSKTICRGCKTEFKSSEAKLTHVGQSEKCLSVEQRLNEHKREYLRKWYQTKVGKKSARAASVKYYSLHKDKSRARAKLRYAVYTNMIKKLPCEVCGSQERIQGHHYKGYSYPYDVRWLCQPHHLEIHGRLIKKLYIDKDKGTKSIKAEK